MTMFQKALLMATYKDGRVGNLSEAHKKAEYHEFKKKHLFKETKISKEVYLSRLIQHFLILQAIETQLQNLSENQKSTISAFFALSYLGQLWRTPGITQDLQLLGVEPQAIKSRDIAPATSKYVDELKALEPKALLAHFLVHTAGFMHGGHIIQSKYIQPSNRLTSYQIPANQYDFSKVGNFSGFALFSDLMGQIDQISLSDEAYAEVVSQSTKVYEVMSDIYDDLCKMHQVINPRWLAIAGVSIAAAGVIIKLASEYCADEQPLLTM